MSRNEMYRLYIYRRTKSPLSLQSAAFAAQFVEINLQLKLAAGEREREGEGVGGRVENCT